MKMILIPLIMIKLFPLLLTISACYGSHAGGESRPGPAAPQVDRREVGVLVMAHGGDTAWNRAVTAAAAPLAAMVPTAVAYGMADPRTLAEGLDSLRARGVSRVAVVRLFISGNSFRDQTYYFLGLSKTPPEHFVLMGEGEQKHEHQPLDHGLEVATHEHGLMGSPHARRILLERAVSLSSTAGQESVLILAHGMGVDHEDQQVIDAIEPAARLIEDSGFARVRVATLREDWETKRKVSEREVRDFVAGEFAEGRRTLVLPMRLAGFGPYAEVLEGLEYTAGMGLLPHPEVADWIRVTATEVVCEAGWGAAVDLCPHSVSHGSDRPR